LDLGYDACCLSFVASVDNPRDGGPYSPTVSVIASRCVRQYATEELARDIDDMVGHLAFKILLRMRFERENRLFQHDEASKQQGTVFTMRHAKRFPLNREQYFLNCTVSAWPNYRSYKFARPFTTLRNPYRPSVSACNYSQDVLVAGQQTNLEGEPIALNPFNQSVGHLLRREDSFILAPPPGLVPAQSGLKSNNSVAAHALGGNRTLTPSMFAAISKLHEESLSVPKLDAPGLLNTEETPGPDNKHRKHLTEDGKFIVPSEAHVIQTHSGPALDVAGKAANIPSRLSQVASVGISSGVDGGEGDEAAKPATENGNEFCLSADK
jgi:hypothetical protein